MSDVAPSSRKLRGSRTRNPLGALTDYRRDPLSLFYREAVKHRGSVRIRLAHQHIHLLVEPEHIRHVLAAKAANYTKGISYDSLRHLLGDGLLTSEGELWQRQRTLTKPAFSRARTTSQIPLVVDCALRMVDTLAPKAGSGAVFDLVPHLMSFSLDVVCRAVLGTDIEDLLPQIQGSTPQCERWIIRNMSSVLRLPPAVPTPANLRFQRLRASMWHIVDQVVERHRNAESEQITLLGTLLAAHDDRGHVMDDSQLRDEVMTFVLAGHETSASGAVWTIYELCQHPEWMEAVIAEIDGVDLGSPDLASAVPRLELTGQAIDEAMRLHPPIWAFTRTAGHADSFGDFDINSGSIVVISPFVNHRFPDFWPSPLRFDPMRFTVDQVRNRPQLHYFPYGFGAHHCVGVNLAAVAMRVAVALFLSRFDVELVSGMHVGENPQIVNTPDPIMVRINRRGETK
jgi:cytochrome P450